MKLYESENPNLKSPRPVTPHKTPVVTNRHLLDARACTRLSVSDVDRRRFEGIYAHFVGAHSQKFELEFREGSMDNVGCRTTQM